MPKKGQPCTVRTIKSLQGIPRFAGALKSCKIYHARFRRSGGRRPRRKIEPCAQDLSGAVLFRLGLIFCLRQDDIMIKAAALAAMQRGSMKWES